MAMISSRSNSKIKSVRALRSRRARQESRLFIVEGIFHIGEAIEADAIIEAIYYAPELLTSEYAQGIIKQSSNLGIQCLQTSPNVFRSISAKENPQGILAVVQQKHFNMEDFSPQNFHWGVALVSPQDPGNLGSILRTVDAVKASGLILIGDHVDPYHPNAVRACMGSIFWNPVISTGFEEFIDWTSTYNYSIYGSSTGGEISLQELTNINFPCILLMGSERTGLTPDQLKVCQSSIKIPMFGRSTSLNLAVAAGILLYKMREFF